MYIGLSVRYSVTAFVATVGTRCVKYTSRCPPITVEMFMSIKYSSNITESYIYVLVNLLYIVLTFNTFVTLLQG